MRLRMEKYKICVSRPHQKTITFIVDRYNLTDNDTLISFVDRKTGASRRFPVVWIEIEVIEYE